MSETRKAAERLAFRFLCLLLAVFALTWVLPQVWDKLSPFIISIPVAAALQPVIRFFRKKLKMKPSPAALIPVLLLLGLFLGLTIWLFSVGIEQVSHMVNHSGDLVTESINSIRTAMNNLMQNVSQTSGEGVENWLRLAINGMLEKLTVWGSSAAEQMVTFSVNLAASLPYALIYISFLSMGIFFVSRDYDEIRSYLPGGKRRKQDSKSTELTNAAVRSLGGYLRVQGTFGLIVWVVSWIYLALFGFEHAGLTALCAGVMELVPMIGSGVPYIALSIIQFLLGNTDRGLQFLFLTLGLQLLRRVLEPKLMSDSIGITPLESLVGMFVGMRFGGIIGLIGGPVLMSVLVGAVRSGLFNRTISDFRILTAYFRNRWR